MDDPDATTDDPTTRRVSNLLLQKQWLLCAIYALDRDGDTPATRDAILRRQAAYSQATGALPTDNAALTDHLDHLVALDILTETPSDDTPTYDLAIDPDTLRAGLQNSPRFQLTKQMADTDLL